MEGEHGRAVALLLVELDLPGLALAHRQRLRRVAADLLRRGLDVEEDNLLGDAEVILGADDELAAVAELGAVDDEGVVVADVALHVLDALPQLGVVVVPRHLAVRHGDDAAVEARGVALDGEGRDRLDDEARRGALAVDQHLLHAVLLHLELAQRAELRESAQRQLEVGPVGVLLTDLVADGEEPLAGDLQGLVAVVAGEPGVLEALVGGQALLLLLGEQLTDEVLALLADVAEGLLVELPVAVLDVLQRLDVGGAGEGREAGEEDVGKHANRPHVGKEADGLALHDLRSRELGRARRDLDQLVGVELGGQAEVDYLDVGRLGRLAHHVLGLDVWREVKIGIKKSVETVKQLRN